MVSTYLKPTTSQETSAINATHYIVKLGSFEPRIIGQGSTISTDVEVKLTDDSCPLCRATISGIVTYENGGGIKKLPIIASLKPYVGTPSMSLSLNASSVVMTPGEMKTYKLDVLITRLKTKCRLEIIMESSDNASFYHINAIRVLNVGSNLQGAISNAQPTLKTTGTNNFVMDMAEIDFGTIVNDGGSTDDIPENKITLEMDIVMNDHHNISTGKKVWIGAAMYAEPKMILVRQLKMEMLLPSDNRPRLTFDVCTVQPTALAPGATFEYALNISHKNNGSSRFATNITIHVVVPPTLSYVQVKPLSSPGFEDDNVASSIRQAVIKYSSILIFRREINLTFSMSIASSLSHVDTDFFTPITIRYEDIEGNSYAFSKTITTSMKKPAVYPPLTSLMEGSNVKPEFYKRGIAHFEDASSDVHVYVCVDRIPNSPKAACYHTKNAGNRWTPLSPIVGCVLGAANDGTILAISYDGRTYLLWNPTIGHWVQLEDSEKQALSLTTAYIIASDDDPEDMPPNPVVAQLSSGKFGAFHDGAYHKPSGGAWTKIATWECNSCT